MARWSQPSRIFKVTGTSTAAIVASIRAIEVAHQRRARVAIGDMARRATHVDVDDLSALPGRDPRAFGHPPGFAARDLHHMATDPRRFQPQPCIALAGRKCRASRHLGYDETGAKPRRQATERRIGDAGHGRQHHWIGKAHIPDHHGRCRRRRSGGHAHPVMPRY
jgi:hypothetical protein